VPGGDERDSEFISGARAGDADVTRAGDVHDIRAEFPDGAKGALIMPREQKIKSKMEVKRERNRPAIELEDFQRSVL
jgi:hypothetical protein